MKRRRSNNPKLEIKKETLRDLVTEVVTPARARAAGTC